MQDRIVKGKTLSAMEKILPSQEPILEENGGMMLKNEHYHFQLAFYGESGDRGVFGTRVRAHGGLAEYMTLGKENLVASSVTPTTADDYYISKEPCLLYDPILPFGAVGLSLTEKVWRGVWVSVRLSDDVQAGVYETTFELLDIDGQTLKELSYTIEVLDAELPETDLRLTNWMHYDGIARQHGIELFTPEFYEVFDGYLKLYVESGFNMLLTPLFTPPLDTCKGGERMTAQLVDVTVTDGEFSFGFGKLKEFLDFVLARGVRYIEFSHLFTQWGGTACPKIMANVDGKTERIFGWDTPSNDERYLQFLKGFFKELCAFLDRENLCEKCYFHLTDEPGKEHIGFYESCRNAVKRYIGDMPIMDAMCDYEFYEKGLVDLPVVGIDSSGAFEEKGVKDIFIYNCCVPANGYYTNRFINMPSQRTRVLGVQMYQSGVKGYLHWGYNFYNSWLSYEAIDPYADVTAGGVFPAGDGFIVYPYQDGAVPSVRLWAVQAGFQDYRALKCLEEKIGRERTLDLLKEWGLNGYQDYPKAPNAIDELRRKINLAIKVEKS